MTRKIQWGILSTANIGIKRVIPAILSGERGAIGAIASRDASRAAEVAARFAIPRSHGSYEALLDDSKIDAIYNPLPNHLHVEWTVKALNAGKHVLCEKPLGLNAPETQAIVDARDRSQKRVIEAFMVRHHPQWDRVRALVRAGRIGTVRSIQSAFLFTVLDPHNVRNQAELGGGALYDVGCYPLVAARYVFGAEPVRVIALIDRDAASPVAAGIASELAAVGRDLGDGVAVGVAHPGVMVRVDGEGDWKTELSGGISAGSGERLAGAGEKSDVLIKIVEDPYGCIGIDGDCDGVGNSSGNIS